MDRRTLLKLGGLTAVVAGTSAFTLSSPLANDAAVSADVAIIGGGVSGLVAARAVARTGRSVVVLEARDRVGGRTWTAHSKGRQFDLGGQFLGPTQTSAIALCDEFKIRTTPSNTDGENILERGANVLRFKGDVPSSGVPEEELGAFGKTVETFEALVQAVGRERPWDHPQAQTLDVLPFAAWVAQQTTTAFTADFMRIATTAIIGLEPSEVSTLCFAYYCAQGDSFSTLIGTRNGAQDRWISDGAQTIALKLAEQLGEKVILNAPVTRIAKAGALYRIDGAGRSVTARQVILAMPPAAENAIAFDPWLPPERVELQSRMPMGAYAKVVAVYPKAFWREKGLSGLIASTRGPIVASFDETDPGGGYGAVLGFIAGDHARAWRKLDANGRKGAVLAQLSRLLGREASSPVDYLEKDWIDEPWTRGAPMAVPAPGALVRSGRALRGSYGGIHLAGTEAAAKWTGYIDGAARAGLAAGQAALARLA